jgi:hypothetical protein
MVCVGGWERANVCVSVCASVRLHVSLPYISPPLPSLSLSVGVCVCLCVWLPPLPLFLSSLSSYTQTLTLWSHIHTYSTCRFSLGCHMFVSLFFHCHRQWVCLSSWGLPPWSIHSERKLWSASCVLHALWHPRENNNNTITEFLSPESNHAIAACVRALKVDTGARPNFLIPQESDRRNDTNISWKE